MQQALDLMNAAAPKVAPHGQCEGFYQVIDWIREHHPATVLEACASGGRRVDLETASRFHTFWISDHTIDPDIVRFHLEGMNYFLP